MTRNRRARRPLDEQHFAAEAPRISVGRAMGATGRVREARDLLRDVYERVLAERGADDRPTTRVRDALDELEPGPARR